MSAWSDHTPPRAVPARSDNVCFFPGRFRVRVSCKFWDQGSSGPSNAAPSFFECAWGRCGETTERTYGPDSTDVTVCASTPSGAYLAQSLPKPTHASRAPRRSARSSILPAILTPATMFPRSPAGTTKWERPPRKRPIFAASSLIRRNSSARRAPLLIPVLTKEAQLERLGRARKRRTYESARPRSKPPLKAAPPTHFGFLSPRPPFCVRAHRREQQVS